MKYIISMTCFLKREIFPVVWNVPIQICLQTKERAPEYKKQEKNLTSQVSKAQLNFSFYCFCRFWFKPALQNELFLSEFNSFPGVYK